MGQQAQGIVKTIQCHSAFKAKGKVGWGATDGGLAGHQVVVSGEKFSVCLVCLIFLFTTSCYYYCFVSTIKLLLSKTMSFLISHSSESFLHIPTSLSLQSFRRQGSDPGAV